MADSAEYRSLLLLCFAYQRTNFIERFFNVPLDDAHLQYEDLEALYGFAYMDGMSKEILEPFYDNQTVRPAVPARIQHFVEMTTLDKAVSMNTSRGVLNVLCKRIRKSDKFFPQVRNFNGISIQLIAFDLLRSDRNFSTLLF